jgi:hypothetical protein
VSDAVNRFYNSIENASGQTQATLVGLFVYFLTVDLGQEVATAKQVADCFAACDLTIPANVSARLSDGVKARPQRYIRTNGGYKLQRHMREALSKKLGAEKVVAQTSATLRGLEHKLPEGADKDFLKETITCFEAGADRATIVMAWILALDHLFAHILTHKLADFNAALAANTDKSVKVKVIAQRDDFTDMKESKFIELCRTAKVISNDVRKILDDKLGTRNSAGHPSGITIKKTKVIDFVEDLIENVVLKYPV